MAVDELPGAVDGFVAVVVAFGAMLVAGVLAPIDDEVLTDVAVLGRAPVALVVVEVLVIGLVTLVVA